MVAIGWDSKTKLIICILDWGVVIGLHIKYMKLLAFLKDLQCGKRTKIQTYAHVNHSQMAWI